MTAKKTTTDHLDLWRQVEKTPINHTGTGKVDGQQITTVDPMYMVRKATEMFGPIGIGWGYEVLEDRYIDHSPVLVKGVVVGHEKMHTLKLELWYKWNGEVGKIVQYGHTKAVYVTRDGRWTDDTNPAKKSLTDAMKKCLSLIGISSDVFFGMFDDQEYKAQRTAETRIEQAEDKEQAIEEYRKEYGAWIREACRTIRKVPHVASVVNLANTYMAKVNDKARLAGVDPEKGLAILRKAADEHVADLHRQQAEKQRQQAEQQTVEQPSASDEPSGGEA